MRDERARPLVILCGDPEWFVRYVNEHSEQTITAADGGEYPARLIAGLRVYATPSMRPTEWCLIPDPFRAQEGQG